MRDIFGNVRLLKYINTISTLYRIKFGGINLKARQKSGHTPFLKKDHQWFEGSEAGNPQVLHQNSFLLDGYSKENYAYDGTPPILLF